MKRRRMFRPIVGLWLLLVLATTGLASAQPAPPPTSTPTAVTPAPGPADAITPSANPAPTPTPAIAPKVMPPTVEERCDLAKAKLLPKVFKPPPKTLIENFLPILCLLIVIIFVVRRLPKVDLGYSAAFKRRRLLNWLPLGLTYAFLYMGRYNLNVFKTSGGITESEFGTITFVGFLVYGFSFLLNGPLTDRWGGRFTILLSSAGSATANLLMGLAILTGIHVIGPVADFAVLYGVNMYFQSFGAVSIVKVNASWFQTRERGTFGGIFGILISLGIFFAFEGGFLIVSHLSFTWLFLIPALLLATFFVLSYIFVYDSPSDVGLPDLPDSVVDDGSKPSIGQVIWKMISNPIILTISLVELCSGFLRQAIMAWGQDFGKGIGIFDHPVMANWGVVLCISGIVGGVFAGSISDHIFNSRRGPVSAVLYSFMLFGAIAIVPLLAYPPAVPWVVAFMSMAIIGVHGMLSGTASADFGGKKNAGLATGIIDGFVYLGSAIQALIYGATLPANKVDCPGTDGKITVPNPEAANVDNWHVWPYAMIPVALIGLILAARLWNARAKGSGGH